MPRSHLTAYALAILLLSHFALLRADEAPKGDKELEGEWRSTSFSIDGKEHGDGNTVLTISGDKLTVGPIFSSHPKTATFKVDAGKTPRTIDMTPQDGQEKGAVALGIYEVKGDALRLCHAAPGLDRPTQFESGDRVSLMVFKRVKTAPADASKGDKDLNGTWEQVSVVRDGKEAGAPPDGAPVLAVQGESVSLTMGGETRKGTASIDAMKTPRQIDITPDEGPGKDMPMVGVYEVKGDELRICFGDPTKKTRPTELSAKEGSGNMLITLKRVKK